MHRKLAVMLLAVTLSACGTATERGGGEEPETRLEISVQLGAEGETMEAELLCPEGRGTGYLKESGEEACRVLEAEESALYPEPDRVCTQQYGGPEEATIRGVLDGEALEVRVTRTDGCGIADWDRLVGLLPRAG